MMFHIPTIPSKRQRQMQEDAERAIRYAAEQLQRKPSKVEALARAYCEELGYNPDDPSRIGARRWMEYREVAEAALHKEAMERAMAKISHGHPK